VRLDGLSKLKNPMTSGIEPTTFLLVAQCLNQLLYHVCYIHIGYLTFYPPSMSTREYEPTRSENKGPINGPHKTKWQLSLNQLQRL
jgi:hypothetical protein